MSDKTEIKLPEGFTRIEIMESLYILRDDAMRLEKIKDPCFSRWPDIDMVLDFINEHGFPPKQ